MRRLFDPRWLYRQRREVGAALLIAALVVALQLAGSLYLLHRAETDAMKAAETSVELAVQGTEQGVQRQLDGLVRLQDNLLRAAEIPADHLQELALARGRIRALVLDPRYAVSEVAILAPNRADDWHSATAAAPVSPGALEAFRTRAIAPGEIHFGTAELGPTPGNWWFPAYFRLAQQPGAEAGIAVVVFDGQRLAAILSGLEIRPGQITGLWRGDGAILAMSAKDGIGIVARHGVMPMRPGPGGRLNVLAPSPLVGYERFFAFHKVEGYDLFLSASSARDDEMASFYRLRRVAIVLEIAAILLVLAFAGMVLVMRSRRRVRIALERSLGEQALVADSEASLREVLDGINAGISRLTVGPGAEFTRTYCNTGLARLVRRPFEEVAGVYGVDAFAEPRFTMADTVAAIATLRETGSLTYENRVRCGDGQLRWMRFNIQSIHRDGDVMDCIALITDVELEKAAAAAAVLSARLATLGELSAGIAHEMKQPLTVIALIAETTQIRVADTPPMTPDEIIRSLQRIIAMVDRARTITEHLRGIARRQDEGLTSMAVEEAIDGALLMCRAALRDGLLQVERDIAADVPPVVGHVVLVEQVLINLLMNARDATAETTTANRRLWITATLEAGRVVVRVRDNGPGFQPAVIPHLFEPFFTTKPPGVGTGLGLSICASILKACGGNIEARNAPEGGAEFAITLLPVEAEAALSDA